MNSNGLTRRGFIGTTSAFAGGLGLLQSLYAQTAAIAQEAPSTDGNANLPSGQPGKDYTPVITPNGSSLPWKIVDGVKDFNVLTMNARCYPGTAPLVVKQNALVRIRLGNLGAMDHHPIHLHGHRFFVTETDGGQIAASARRPETTVLVAVGQTRTIEFIADAPGDWAFHCHMTHHVMNQMGHDAPNVVGMKPGDLDKQIRTLVPGYMTMGQDGMGGMGEMGMPVPKNSIPMVGGRGPFGEITMGGMFTILKVRPELADYPANGGWYKNPKGEVATVAPEEDLRRDGIKV